MAMMVELTGGFLENHGEQSAEKWAVGNGMALYLAKASHGLHIACCPPFAFPAVSFF